MHEDLQTIELRPAAEWRRVVYYADFGAGIAIGIIAWLNLVGVGQKWKDFVGLIFFVLPIICLNILVQTSRIQIEIGGIRRRRWLQWDFWPWDLFASGTLKRPSNSDFLDPSRPLGFRRLNLEFLAEEERIPLIKRIDSLWQISEVPKAEFIEIYEANALRTRFDEQGILHRRWIQKPLLIPWSEITQIECQRFDHSRRDFVRIRIAFKSRLNPLAFRYDSCSNPEQFVQLLKSYVPVAKWFIIGIEEQKSLAEVDYLLNKIKKDEKDCRSNRHIAWSFLGIPILIRWEQNPIRWNIDRWLLIFGFSVIITGCFVQAFFWALRLAGNFKNRIAKLESRRAELLAENSTALGESL